jgi:hypothetical protein
MFSELRFPALLQKGMTLSLEVRLKESVDNDNIIVVTFPTIKNPGRPPRLVVNYLLEADFTGATAGDWVLVDRAIKNPTEAVKDGIEISIGVPSRRITVEYGKFRDIGGIPVKEMTGSRVTRHNYSYRLAPKLENGVYTAASRSARVTATSEQRAPRHRIQNQTQRLNRDGTVQRPAATLLRLRKGDIVFSGVPHSFSSNSSAPVDIDSHRDLMAGNILRATKSTNISIRDLGIITVRQEATARRSASARQDLSVAGPIINAHINVIVPETGVTPSMNATIIRDTRSFTVSSLEWEPIDDPFQPETQYKAIATLTANTGFTFTGLENATINGETATIENNTGGTVMLLYIFGETEAEPEPTPITSVDITVTAPIDGETPDDSATGTGDFTIGSVTWDPVDDPFQSGEIYTVTVTLTANDGFTFIGLIEATINGETATIQDNTGETVTLLYTF